MEGAISVAEIDGAVPDQIRLLIVVQVRNQKLLACGGILLRKHNWTAEGAISFARDEDEATHRARVIGAVRKHEIEKVIAIEITGDSLSRSGYLQSNPREAWLKGAIPVP